MRLLLTRKTCQTYYLLQIIAERKHHHNIISVNEINEVANS